MPVDRWDVAERLAQGRPAVEHTERYVRACQMLGYHHPDLTSHPGQVRDWYDSEDGLDLRALDGDCGRLRAAAAAVAEALRMQRAQVIELAAAWTGPGAAAAVGFLQRHCDAANAVAAEVRATAQRCESLRDNLWYLLDAKVATTIAIDDRTLAQRPSWLAAAEVVVTGVGDQPTAQELIHQQIKPYVDNDIRTDWLTTMRSTLAGVAASYDMITDRLARSPRAYFETPGDLGPGRPTGGTTAAPTTPVTAVVPPAAAPAALAARTPAPAPLSDLAAGPGSAAPTGSPPDPGGPGGLGGLGGLASRIVEALGDLLGSASEDPSGPEDAFDGDAFDEDADDKSDHRDHSGPEKAEKAESAAPVEPPVAQPAPGERPMVEPVPPEVAPPNAAPSVSDPPPGAATPGQTPCQIAADELPQAGQ